jgi:CheY-like chemotaxis protein
MASPAEVSWSTCPRPWVSHGSTPADLRRAIAATGETLGPGDILVFNTGFEALQRSRGTAPGAGVPTGGLQIECAELLHASQPALIISDLGMDTWPSEVENVQIPWHVLCIVMMGVRLVDCAHVEGLLEVTRRLRRSTFLCVVSPVEYPGATSSPVNPICVF